MKTTNLMKSLVLGAMMVGGSFLHAQVSDWCDTPTGHFGNPEEGVNSRVLLTITKGEEPNTVLLTLKPNAEAGNTVGLDYLYVTATNATPYPAVIGADGTEALGDLSVTLTFSEGTTQTDYMIQYSNPNWDGRWQIELKNVPVNAACGDDVECELTQAPTMTSATVDSYTHNTVVLNVAGTDEKGGAISRFLVSWCHCDKVNQNKRSHRYNLDHMIFAGLRLPPSHHDQRQSHLTGNLLLQYMRLRS